MELLFIILGIIISVVNASNKKKKQAEAAEKRRANVRSLEEETVRADERLRDYRAQRQKGQARSAAATVAPTVAAQARPQTTTPEASWRCACGAINRGASKFCTECGKARYGGSLNYASSEGKTVSQEGAAVPVMRTASLEGAAMPVMRPAAPEGSPRPAAPTVRHVVKPLTESGHSHVESSMTGVEDCYDTPQPDAHAEDAHAEDAYAIGARARNLPFGLSLDRNAVVQGLLYAEILGKPKALRN